MPSHAQDNVAVVMAPVNNLRTSLMTLSSEGRVIDENLFFFAAGMESVTGGVRHSPSSHAARAGMDAKAKGDFVSRFGHLVGAAWMGGAVLYAATCMNFAY